MIDTLLTRSDLAALLHISIRTLPEWRRTPGRVPAPLRTGGRRTLWLESDITAWLSAWRQGGEL